MSITRLATTAAVAAAVALTPAAAASADAGHGAAAELPKSAKVLSAPEKRLSLKKAARLRAQIRRTRRFPAPPRLEVHRRHLSRMSAENRGPAQPAADSGVKSSGDTERMFGSESSYWSKRDPILNAIQSFNAINVPRNGGRYVSPRLYELQHGGQIAGCTGAVINGMYCGGSVNSIGWSMTWTANAFRESGDMKWATLIAHEYGHAAQQFLGISGGWMQYKQYSEGFADCMAGAFLYHASYYKLTDNVGRGDGYEFRDAFVSLASPTTELHTHGTFTWRYALATYGWNTGFDGCARWARSIDGV